MAASIESDQKVYDTAIVGGGIHGVAMAAESASRGLSTLLFQSKDFGSGLALPIDSCSNNLRRFEKFQLPSITSSMSEVAKLEAKACYLCNNIRTYVVANPKVRSKTKISAGLSLYNRWNSKTFKNQPSKQEVQIDTFSESFKDSLDKQLSFNDAQINTSRLIIAIAQAAERYGAQLFSFTELVSATRHKDYWQLTVLNKLTEQTSEFKAKILINCCGWGAEKLLGSTLNIVSRCKTTRAMSGYIYLNCDTPPQHPIVIQKEDHSLLYVAGIGPSHICVQPVISANAEQENCDQAIESTLTLINQQLNKSFTQADIDIVQWKALPNLNLQGNESSQIIDENRDKAVLDLNNPGELALALSLFGINTSQHRKIAEEAFNILEVFNGASINPDFAKEKLPGGNIPYNNLDAFSQEFKEAYSYLKEELLHRYIHTYGANVYPLLSSVAAQADLGEHFGHGLYQVEVNYLIEHEWSQFAEDILWRRTFLGLYFTQDEVEKLQDYIDTYKK